MSGSDAITPLLPQRAAGEPRDVGDREEALCPTTAARAIREHAGVEDAEAVQATRAVLAESKPP